MSSDHEDYAAEHAALNDLLAQGQDPEPSGNASREEIARPSPTQRQDLDLCQWQVAPNGMFRPAARTVKHIHPGAFMMGHDDRGPFLVHQVLLSDKIVDLPNTANMRVLSVIRKFWLSRDRYVKHGLVFKRGILLYGPPGSGKTITVHLLSKDLIERGGIVLFCTNPGLALLLIGAVRRIEKERPLIVVLEDIDEIIRSHSEHDVLSMLDGENNTDNVVFIACPAPETMILKADLTWVRADSLSIGDSLIAFDENGPQRKFRTATVNSCHAIVKKRYRVTTTTGVTTVSTGHPFLVKVSTGHWHQWKLSETLLPGDQIASIGVPWTTDMSREGGYLAGQYDGEGCLNFSLNQHGSISFRAAWVQARGAVSDRMIDILTSKGFTVAEFSKRQIMGRLGLGMGITGPHKPQVSLTINGGRWETLRFLGSIRPYRLLSDSRLSRAWENNRLCPSYATVVSVEDIGDGPVIALDTTTKTFIGDGLLQHNTTNYPERLGGRIVNRPSRFDDRIFVGMPSPEARRVYLLHATGDEALAAQWAADTQGLSIAHLRELVAAVMCLDQDYEEVLVRLRSMNERPKENEEFAKRGLGFNSGTLLPVTIRSQQ